MSEEKIGLFKLTSGEEIVAIYDETMNIFTISKARAILLGRTATGLTLQLGPWILSEQDAEYVIDKNHIVTTNLKLSPQLIQAYLQNVTGIDIQTNASNLIV